MTNHELSPKKKTKLLKKALKLISKGARQFHENIKRGDPFDLISAFSQLYRAGWSFLSIMEGMFAFHPERGIKRRFESRKKFLKWIAETVKEEHNKVKEEHRLLQEQRAD